jgi:DNA-directed RNA polymerase subunit RPC12/RpoP
MSPRKQQYLAWVEQIRASGDGKRLRTYKCPSCSSDIETFSPARADDVWDTLSTCPHCDAMHFKVQIGFEPVSARALPEAVA